MDCTALTRRSAVTLATHAPHVAGAIGLAVLAQPVLPFDGHLARFLIAFVAGIVGGKL
jgi:hypothetical protein